MVIEIVKYLCKFCRESYSSRKIAEECEDEGMPEQKFQINQVVKMTLTLPGLRGRNLAKVQRVTVRRPDYQDRTFGAVRHTNEYTLKFIDEPITTRSFWEHHLIEADPEEWRKKE